MSYQRYLDKFNDAVWEFKHGIIVTDVTGLIIKQEHGDVKK